MSVKVFTLEEANRLIPQVRETILWLRERVLSIRQLEDAISVLKMIGADSKDSPEHAEWQEKRGHHDEAVERYNARLEEFGKLGCFIKDIDKGLVDFYGEKEGRLVFLCWKLGEERIRYWHEVNSGYGGRQLLED